VGVPRTPVSFLPSVLRVRRLPLAILVLFATACGDDVGVSGVWTGATAGGVGFTFTMVETPQGVVSGSGRVLNGLSPLPINVTGAHAHPTLSLTIDFPRVNLSPISYQGTFNASMSAVKGALYGSGFGTSSSPDSLVLTRTTVSPLARLTGP